LKEPISQERDNTAKMDYFLNKLLESQQKKYRTFDAKEAQSWLFKSADKLDNTIDVAKKEYSAKNSPSIFCTRLKNSEQKDSPGFKNYLEKINLENKVK